MNGLYKENEEHYFAASNTKDGFVSYFDEIFGKNECDRVYILKGGPGCGKSTFMKKLGTLAEEKGLSCEYFHCSSDPESLDGIIIKEKRIAVVDGTSPHAVEPQLSGAREIIINLGDGWDTDKLYDKKDEIQTLSDKKRELYRECYSCLYSKNVMEGLAFNLISKNILFDKLRKCALKTAKSIFKNCNSNHGFCEKTRISEAISSAGKMRLFTFENMADSCIFLKLPFHVSGLSRFFLKELHTCAKSLGHEVYVSYAPDKKGEINGLYFPSAKVSVSEYDETAVDKCDKTLKKCKIINLKRFLDTKDLSRTKPLRKFYTKISKNMENQAIDALGKAGKTHADIEKIYRQCTNYTTVEKISDEYINKILNS